ncbi:hypothetical protein D1007_09317 [Hordeum vulgare]|nr:hypothetical protein D1007_09317 [Hordeum vulgare]
MESTNRHTNLCGDGFGAASTLLVAASPPWYSSSHLSCLHDICCAPMPQPHITSISASSTPVTVPCGSTIDAMTVPSKGSSEEIGLGSWSKSKEDANSCSCR